MSRSKTTELRGRGYTDKEIIQKLEDENNSILKLNEIYQSELKQKSEALERSCRDYSRLKKQYEELLVRLTELSTENRTFQTPPPSPSSSPQQEVVISSLEAKIKKLSSKVRELRDENEGMKADVAQLPVLEQWNSAFKSYYETMAPLYPMQTSPYLYLVETAKAVSADMKRMSLLSKKYERTKKAYRSILQKCEKFAGSIDKNNFALQEVRYRVVPGTEESERIETLREIERYISNFE